MLCEKNKMFITMYYVSDLEHWNWNYRNPELMEEKTFLIFLWMSNLYYNGAKDVFLCMRIVYGFTIYVKPLSPPVQVVYREGYVEHF